MKKNIKLFISYVVPSMISMLIAGSFSIVDSIFIGQSSGKIGLAAVSVTWPLLMLFGALGDLFGTGAAIIVSQSKGRKELDKAKEAFGNMLCLLFFISLFLGIIVYWNLADILLLFGATEEMLPLSVSYAIILVVGNMASMLMVSLVSIIRNDGRPDVAMWLTVCGLLLNIVLDYVFIFPMQGGLVGAAYATLLSQALCSIAGILYFASRYTELRYCRSMFKITWQNIKQISVNGIPSFGNQMTIIGMLFLHNYQSIKYGGVNGLAVYTFIGAVESLGSMLMTGLSLGVQPLVSFLYGSKKYVRQNIIGNMGYYTAFFIGVILMGISILGRNIFPSWFNLTGEVAQMASHGLVISSTAFLLLGVVRVAGFYYQSTGKIGIASLLVYGDAFIVLPLCLFILPLYFGLDGVWLAMPVSRVILFAFVCWIWFGIRTPKMGRPFKKRYYLAYHNKV